MKPQEIKELLTTKEAAALIKVAPATLVDWRHDRKGPKYFKLNGRMVRYRLSDILAWLDQVLEPVRPDRP